MKRKYLIHLKNRILSGDYKWFASSAMKYIGIPLSAMVNRPLVGPIMAGMLLTYECNYRCLYCDYPNRDNGDKRTLTLDERMRVIDTFKELGVMGVGFSGGEPLLYQDIYALIRHVKKRGLTASVGTNGSMVDEITAEKLLLTGIDMVALSIDAPVPEVHNKLRGIEGSFERVITAFKNLKKAKEKYGLSTPLVINSVFTLQNIDYINQMPDFAKDLGANSVNILGIEEVAVQKNFEARMKEVSIPPDQIHRVDQVVDQLIKRKNEDGMIDNSVATLKFLKRKFRGEKMPIRCYAGNTSLYVDSYGDVFPCMSHVEQSRSAGNIFEKDLKSLWKSWEYGQLRKNLSHCRDCYFVCQNEFNVMFSLKAKFIS